jgi:hypothetical protein
MRTMERGCSPTSGRWGVTLKGCSLVTVRIPEQPAGDRSVVGLYWPKAATPPCRQLDPCKGLPNVKLDLLRTSATSATPRNFGSHGAVGQYAREADEGEHLRGTIQDEVGYGVFRCKRSAMLQIKPGTRWCGRDRRQTGGAENASWRILLIARASILHPDGNIQDTRPERIAP